jgi:hypothetical protein
VQCNECVNSAIVTVFTKSTHQQRRRRSDLLLFIVLPYLFLFRQEGEHHLVEVVEEAEQVEPQLVAALRLVVRELVAIERDRGIIDAWFPHRRATRVTLDVPPQQRQVDENQYPLALQRE